MSHCNMQSTVMYNPDNISRIDTQDTILRDFATERMVEIGPAEVRTRSYKSFMIQDKLTIQLRRW